MEELNTSEFTNKIDFINYVLRWLNNNVHAVPFGKLFVQISPSGGIENFRHLLDELTEEGLVSRMSLPGNPVPGLPGIQTLDLRYGISLKGIKYLSELDEKHPNKTKQMKKEVFVTYSWDSEEHKKQVREFTNQLRKSGFAAEMDSLHTQNNSAADFYKMMHQAMTDYDKVIIVLSKGYKQKAEEFKGGVGNEYNLIIKDIEDQPNKYILVSFDGVRDEIMPLNFKGRQVLDLSKEVNWNDLYAKLQNVKTFEFAEVGNKKPVVYTEVVGHYESTPQNLEIGILKAVQGDYGMSGGLYKTIDYELQLDLINPTGKTFDEYVVEVKYPYPSIGYESCGERDGKSIIVRYDQVQKLFPGQKRNIVLEKFTIRNTNAKEILNASVEVTIYTPIGNLNKTFYLKEILTQKDMYGEKPLALENFSDPSGFW